MAQGNRSSPASCKHWTVDFTSWPPILKHQGTLTETDVPNVCSVLVARPYKVVCISHSIAHLDRLFAARSRATVEVKPNHAMPARVRSICTHIRSYDPNSEYVCSHTKKCKSGASRGGKISRPCPCAGLLLDAAVCSALLPAPAAECRPPPPSLRPAVASWGRCGHGPCVALYCSPSPLSGFRKP